MKELIKQLVALHIRANNSKSHTLALLKKEMNSDEAERTYQEVFDLIYPYAFDEPCETNDNLQTLGEKSPQEIN